MLLQEQPRLFPQNLYITKKDAPNAPRRLNPKGLRFDRPRVFYDLIVHPSHGAARPFKKG